MDNNSAVTQEQRLESMKMKDYKLINRMKLVTACPIEVSYLVDVEV